ncbi:myotubularin-related protein 4 isoform X3 [Aricia agestis]|uniref:myotubularin-related protein 4 isoform X3 n=1 Tax=Aricia agestis TaxID=91739 RepID=UPI001C20B9BC|nr:myotubularin-related protein 4 isoform X3 [Aricia agestis]
MLINTFLDTEDFVHLYYPDDEPPAAQGCGAGARLASKYPQRSPSPEYKQQVSSESEMSERERYRSPPQPEPPPHRVRAADLYPRLRAHYDEPAIEPGFTPICGEFIQWVGRTSDGGSIAMSNYRLHLQPKRRGTAGASLPLRLIDALEIRELLTLIVLCKHGRQLKCTFTTGEQCLEWWRRLNTAIIPVTSAQETFAAAYAAWAKEQPPSSVHRALIRASLAPQPHWFQSEFDRLGFNAKGPWRITVANADYKLCPSYPQLLIVPASICDEDLDSVARFRAMRRMPAVVWRHRGTGAVIARSSQPEVGWLGWRSSEDERLLAAYVAACNADRPHPNKQLKLLIVDARSYATAVTNRARGGGCECQQYYPAADIQFMSLPNIHHVRKSFAMIRALLAEPSDQPNWHSGVERTLWLQYLSGVCRAAATVARAVLAARPVLVHCSDGWDRTPQVVASAQLLLDPYYRTVQGFRVLIEREWLDFGHKFGDRCGHMFGAEDTNERSPIFLQWLHVVYQLMTQYPCSFEFNEAYLIKLATHVYSCMFGTFLCNTSRERAECRTGDTASVWHLLSAPAYRNHLYAHNPHQNDTHDQVLWPDCSVRAMQVWWGLMRSELEPPHAPSAPPSPHPAPAPPPAPHTGSLPRRRSFDNFLNDGERKTMQRRSSDSNIAPDVLSLSLVMSSSSPERDCRALTDSCVDRLPDTNHVDQVDGLTSTHFVERGDSSSQSPSVERELVSLSGAGDSPPAAPGESPALPMLGESLPVPILGESPTAPDVDETVFVCGSYTEVRGLAEAARESARSRNISITWRSISESSNQSSSGFVIPENQTRAEPEPSEDVSPENHTSTEEDLVNHNVVADLTSSNDNERPETTVNGTDITPKFLELDINSTTGSSSEASSESEGEPRGASQLTLCPASPRRAVRAPPAAPPAPPAYSLLGSESACACCGACAACAEAARTGADSADGLPPAVDPLQARLHQIILHQKRVVEELSEQLRCARAALRRATSPAAPPPRTDPASPLPPQVSQNGVCGRGGRGSSAASSSSGSASEVEVGEEARGVVWLPDSAAPRCQHCRNQFWLARRRHHCRRCGGIFCGSCSEMSWGEVGAVRVCRRCRGPR